MDLYTARDMDNIGESAERNRAFSKKFSRETLIRSLIHSEVLTPLLLDVGAHKGESVRFLRALFPNAVIHSFEPMPASFATLETLSDTQTHVHNVALGDTDGTIDFFVNKISHTNSIFKVNEESRDSLFFAERRRTGTPIENGTFNERLRVSSARLATFCEEHDIDHIDLLKIDVQGAERKVLEGAMTLLPQIDNIILEIMLFDYYEHRSSFLEIESILQPAGFGLFSISDISQNPMNGRTDWVEAIYRRVARK
jgi:FkbM family methyltransferase